MTTQYVYIKSEPGLYTVGFYDPSGKWHAESDHESTDDAANRVHWLNGGNTGDMDEAEAMFNEHQRMKEAMSYQDVRRHIDYGDI